MLVIGMLPRLPQACTLRELAFNRACPSRVGIEGPRRIVGAQLGLAHVGPLGDSIGRCLETYPDEGLVEWQGQTNASSVTMADCIRINLSSIGGSS